MIRGRLLLELCDGAVHGGWQDRAGRFWPFDESDGGVDDLAGDFWLQPGVGPSRRKKDRPRLLRGGDPSARGEEAVRLRSPLTGLRELEAAGLPEPDREVVARAAGLLLDSLFDAAEKRLSGRGVVVDSFVAIVPAGTTRLGLALLRCSARRHGWHQVQIVPRPLAAALVLLDDVVAERGVVIEATGGALEFHWIEVGGHSQRCFRHVRSEREEELAVDLDSERLTSQVLELRTSDTPWVCLGSTAAGEPWVRAVAEAIGRPPVGRARPERAALEGLLAAFAWLALDPERWLDLETEGALHLADGSGRSFELLPARSLPRRPGDRGDKRQVVRAVGTSAEPGALGFLWGPPGGASGTVPVGVVPGVVLEADGRSVALHFRLACSPAGRLRGTVRAGAGTAIRLSFPISRTRLFDPWSQEETTP